MAEALPLHYQVTIRRFVRFGALGLAIGMALGLIYTHMNKSVRYTTPYDAPAARVDPPEKGVRLRLPVGFRWESGLGFKLSHGHAILVMGVLPLLFAFALLLVAQLGGREISAASLNVSFWLYSVGASGAVAILLYKGFASFSQLHAGNFDIAAIEAGLFAGSKAIKGAAYGTTHSAMAVGAYTLLYQLYRAVAPLGRGAAPSEAGAQEPASA